MRDNFVFDKPLGDSFSLDDLLNHIEETNKLNQSLLDDISSRLNETVTTGYNYSITCKLPNLLNENDNLWSIKSIPTRRTVRKIVDDWKYDGPSITPMEEILFNGINYEVNNFSDIFRLNTELVRIGRQCGKLFADAEEPRSILYSLLGKLKKIRLIIELVRDLTLSREDISKDSVVQDGLCLILEGYEKVSGRVSNANLLLEASGSIGISEMIPEVIPEVDNTSLVCKGTEKGKDYISKENIIERRQDVVTKKNKDSNVVEKREGLLINEKEELNNKILKLIPNNMSPMDFLEIIHKFQMRDEASKSVNFEDYCQIDYQIKKNDDILKQNVDLIQQNELYESKINFLSNQNLSLKEVYESLRHKYELNANENSQERKKIVTFKEIEPQVKETINSTDFEDNVRILKDEIISLKQDLKRNNVVPFLSKPGLEDIQRDSQLQKEKQKLSTELDKNIKSFKEKIKETNYRISLFDTQSDTYQEWLSSTGYSRTNKTTNSDDVQIE